MFPIPVEVSILRPSFPQEDIAVEIKALEKQMREAAKALEFEKATEIRDRVRALRAREVGLE